MNIDDRQLRFFREIAQHRSINRAALHLHITQPALSRRMQRLEHQLGTPLFVRTRSGVDLTPEGRHLFERSTSLSEALTGIAEAQGQAPQASERPTIGIGASAGISLLILDKVVDAFLTQEPTSGLQLVEGNTRELCDKVVDAELEVAVISGRISSSHIESELLWREPMFMVAPHGCEDTLPFALPTRDPLVRHLIETELERLQLPMLHMFELCSAHSVKRLIGKGRACSILPYSALHEEITAGTLQVSQIPEASLSRSLIWRKRAQPRRTTVSMRSMMHAIAQDLYGPASVHRGYVLAP
jgi:LysR family nitrogen assimilation transcriptional regulator